MIDYERTVLLLNVVHMSIGVDQAARHRAWAVQELHQMAEDHAKEIAAEDVDDTRANPAQIGGQPVLDVDRPRAIPSAGLVSPDRPGPVYPSDPIAQNESDLAGHRLDNETHKPVDLDQPVNRKI